MKALFVQFTFMCLALGENSKIIQHTLNDMLKCVDQCIAVPPNNDLLNAMEILNISSIEMMKLNKKSATGTARSIIKFKFPDPPIDFRLSDVNKEIVDAIICKYSFDVLMFHWNDFSQRLLEAISSK